MWRSRAAVRRGDQVASSYLATCAGRYEVNLCTPPTHPPLQPPRAQRLALCVDSLSIPSPFPRTPIPHPGSTGPLEPWLSSCRAVEAPSRRCRGAVEARCRGAVEALSRRPCLSSLSLSSYCRVPVEPVEPDSMRLGVEVCRGLSRSVEVCRGLSRSVEVCRGLSSSCRAVEHVVLADATIKTRLLCTIYRQIQISYSTSSTLHDIE